MIRVERQQSRRLQEISRQFGLSLFIAFGSQVRGTGRLDEHLIYAAVRQVTAELPAFLTAMQRHLG